jgi:Rrf2 family nitric oxide-sensitive transcriptional repressor
MHRPPIPISKLAEALAISRPIAAKVIHQLNKRKLTASLQGRYGGVYLSRDPNEISILDILKAMDFRSTLNECIINHTVCPLVGKCRIHQFFEEQEQILFKSFDQKKISDFAIQDEELKTFDPDKPFY